MLCETHKWSSTPCLLMITLMYKEAAETAAVLPPKEGAVICVFPFAFRTWKRINIFLFFNKRMCLLSLGTWQGYKEGEANSWGEGEEVTDRSPCPLERDPRTGRVMQSHPPSQRRQLDIFHIVFSCVLIPFSRNPVADPQFLSSCSPI